MRTGFLIIACGAALLAACGKSGDSRPSGMPAGYERIDAAFGIRTSGITHAEGVHTAPAVEFRSNGDYAMYSFSTDCSGAFSRGQGVVFAGDGTVREQLPEQAGALLSANPQFKPLADKLCSQVKAARDALVEGDTIRKTRFGVAKVETKDGTTRLTFEGRELGQAFSFSLLRTFAQGNADLVLVNELGGGNGCPGGEYYFLVVTGPRDISASERFGTCSEGKAELGQAGEVVTVAIPDYGSEGKVTYTYRDGIVTSDAPAAAQVADVPETGYADAAADAADAAAAAADQATAEMRGAGRVQASWTGMCVPQSRRVTTPAGSEVGLSENEAQSYCGCLYASAPDAASGILAAGGNVTDNMSTQWREAQAACVSRLL